MILQTLASDELNRRILALENDFQRISSLLGREIGKWCKADLGLEMALLAEDIDRIRAEVCRRAGESAPSGLRSPLHATSSRSE